MSDEIAPAVLDGHSFDEITSHALGAGYFAGSVFRIERKGKLLFEKAWGLSLDTGAEKRPMTPACIFDMASISKIFTTTAILRLVTTGKLHLDDRVGTVLGYSGTRLGELLGGTDIRSALTHSSGIHYWFPFYTKRGEPFESILESVLEEHPPRSEVIYSDLNFMLLGKVVETVAGLSFGARTFGEAVAGLVFAPLGLSRSSYGEPCTEAASVKFTAAEVAATEWGNRIEMAMVKDLGLAFDGWRATDRTISGSCDDGNCHYYFSGAAGHAGIFSDARDLCSLGRLYLNEGRIVAGTDGNGDFDGGIGGIGSPGCAGCGGSAFIDPELTREARLDHGGGRGLGFQLGENYPGSGFGHGGFTGTYMYLNREADVVAAILTNRLHVASPRKVGDYMQAMIRKALDPWELE